MHVFLLLRKNNNRPVAFRLSFSKQFPLFLKPFIHPQIEKNVVICSAEEVLCFHGNGSIVVFQKLKKIPVLSCGHLLSAPVWLGAQYGWTSQASRAFLVPVWAEGDWEMKFLSCLVAKQPHFSALSSANVQRSPDCVTHSPPVSPLPDSPKLYLLAPFTNGRRRKDLSHLPKALPVKGP